jgi:uncharacterized protein (TIGR02588 family)
MRIVKNWLEWSVLAVGIVVLGVVLYVLTVAAIRTKETPPQLQVEFGTAQLQGDRHYRVPVHVRNGGGTTAADVAISVELRVGSQTVERAELTFELVPRGSKREGVVLFTRDPSEGELVSGAITYAAQ